MKADLLHLTSLPPPPPVSLLPAKSKALSTSHPARYPSPQNKKETSPPLTRNYGHLFFETRATPGLQHSFFTALLVCRSLSLIHFYLPFSLSTALFVYVSCKPTSIYMVKPYAGKASGSFP